MQSVVFATLLYLVLITSASAHGVHGHDQQFITSAAGIHPFPFFYLGAKHMVTGYDHLAYLACVIFFLSNIRDVVKFVSLFAIGHSITLLFGVLSGLSVNVYLVDAIIGLSVCYKAIENMGLLKTFTGVTLSAKKAVFGFGLVHGLGLSSKLQGLHLDPDGIVPNMISFNVGVEIGQILGLIFLLGIIYGLRTLKSFENVAFVVNMLLFTLGLVLFGLQATGYFIGVS